MSFTIFNSGSSWFRSPFGAVADHQPVSFRVHLPVSSMATNPCLLVFEADRWDDPQAYPMIFEDCTTVSSIYRVEYISPKPALLFYCFRFEEEGRYRYICKNQDHQGVLCDNRGDLWQLTVYDKDFQTPEFLKGGLIYQIFPDRFYNSGAPKKDVPADRKLKPWGTPPEWRPDEKGQVTNSDYMGGDLKGIEQKLPYLKELGVTAIYLNPIFEAHSNHRYNTADYCKIDPLLGDEADFSSLCAAAKKLGISVFIDGVFSHTGSDSRYFNREGRYPETGAYQSQQSPYAGWYRFESFPEKYASWWGFKTLPEVEETNPDYMNFICGENGVLEKWLKLGGSGYRLDVADELPDAFLDKVNETVKRVNPQALVLGEVWEDASNKISYSVRRRYLLGKQLDSVMNYPYQNAILHYVRYGGGKAFYDQILNILENYPPQVISCLMNSLGTHDTERAITALGGEPAGENGREWQEQRQQLTTVQYCIGRELLMLASILQYTLPGTPCLYYGDEVGMVGYKDPFNRCCFPWDSMDIELLEHFKRLGKLRQENRELFAQGEFIPIVFHDNLCAYMRRLGSRWVITAVNRSSVTQALSLPEFISQEDLLYGSFQNDTLPPLGFAVLTGSQTKDNGGA